jgi:hypothetical protein
MFGEEVIFRSVSTALSVIYSAIQYMVRGLDTLAIRYISKNINSDNVLLVLQKILVFYNTEHSPHPASQEYQVSMNTSRHRTGELWKHVWRTKVQNNETKKDKMTLAELIFFFIVCIFY